MLTHRRGQSKALATMKFRHRVKEFHGTIHCTVSCLAGVNTLYVSHAGQVRYLYVDLMNHPPRHELHPMKEVTVKNSMLILAAWLIWFGSPARAQETPVMPVPQKEHEWLKQFAGEWETESEGTMGPGQPPVKCKGTMSSRMLGNFWVMSELKGNMMGVQTLGIQTIGYDAAAKKYVGTWVDSMMDHLWKYSGTVDAAGKTLTLEADGPNFLQPGKLSKFRDVYEFKSKDHIVATSSMQGEDGKWVTFMTGNLRRKK